ncbi:hypothetical protein [Gymnodinialimonas sp.]
MVSLISTLTAGTASGETILDAQGLDVLLTGHTVYIDTPGGEAPVWYGADGRSAAALPNGVTLIGQWAIDGASYCVDWENGPQNSCTRVTKTDGAIAFTDIASGDPRGTVARIVPGNAENL